MRIDLCQSECWRDSPILDRRTVSKHNLLRVPMNLTNLEEHRCRCDLLITSDAHNLKEHKGSSWSDVYMVTHIARVWIDSIRLPILLVVSWTGKVNIPCPRSRLRIWSRETGSAVPSRVSLFISVLRLNLVRTYGIPPDFRGGVHLFI